MAALDIRATNPPMPTQKAMMRPAISPVTAPYKKYKPDKFLSVTLLTVQHTNILLRILTVLLAQGKNIPRQKSPSKGPPTIPKILRAALKFEV